MDTPNFPQNVPSCKGYSPAAGTILIVDDDPGHTFLMGKVLNHGAGYRVFTAAGAKESVPILGSHRIDLVILDIMIEEVNGLQFLKNLKNENPFLPVIIMTADDSKENIIESLRCRADHWFTKPCDIKELLAIAGVLISKKASLMPLKSVEEENAGLNGGLVKNALKLLSGDCTLSLSQVSERLQTSPKYLSKKFALSGEGTFIERKRQIMIEEAKKILCREYISIKEVSSKIGLRKAPYFRQLFKKVVGFTPHQYRLQK